MASRALPCLAPTTPTAAPSNRRCARKSPSAAATVVSVEYYQPGNSSPQAEARRIASLIEAENRAYPEQGRRADPGSRRAAALGRRAPARRSPTSTPREVRFLGTGQWNDADVWREPGLYGGAFPAPDPAALQDFEKRYQAIYGEAPPRLASFGYDAGALAATLAGADRLDAAMIQRPQGWGGVNGLFRFHAGRQRRTRAGRDAAAEPGRREDRVSPRIAGVWPQAARAKSPPRSCQPSGGHRA